jgi:hypothetical protein
MIDIKDLKERCKTSDPSLAVYMVRDAPEVEAAGLRDLAWALCSGCHRNDALGFFEMLEEHLKGAS